MRDSVHTIFIRTKTQNDGLHGLQETGEPDSGNSDDQETGSDLNREGSDPNGDLDTIT
jgi:hypothetical protein